MFVNVTISLPDYTVLQLNSAFPHDSTTTFEGVQDIIKRLQSLELGTDYGIVQLTIRNSNPNVVATGGGNSATYNLS